MITEEQVRAALLLVALEQYPKEHFGDGHQAICHVLDNASRSSDAFCQALANALYLASPVGELGGSLDKDGQWLPF